MSSTNILAETVLRINMLLMITHYLTGLLFLFHLTKTQYGFMVACGNDGQTDRTPEQRPSSVLRLELLCGFSLAPTCMSDILDNK